MWIRYQYISTICAIFLGIQDQVGFSRMVWVPKYRIYSEKINEKNKS